ncbi:hypothetical protein Tco_1025757, partial [Tanacetum coccineum]
MHINLLLNMATKQEGEEDDSERDEKREHVPRRNVVNFFFTNFPPEWSMSNQVCKRDGWVFDIPPKLNNLQSSSCGNTRFQKPLDDSILLQSNLEGLNSSLEFIQSQEDLETKKVDARLECSLMVEHQTDSDGAHGGYKFKNHELAREILDGILELRNAE